MEVMEVGNLWGRWRVKRSMRPPILPCLLSGLVLFGLESASAQPFYFGVKGGVILSETRQSALYSDRTGTHDYQFALRRHSIGPAFEIGLPARLRLESGFLYRRFRASQNISLGPSSWDAYDIRGSRWEFPLVLKREFSRGRIRPFFGGGGAWSHTPAPNITVATYREFGPPPYQVNLIRTNGSPDNTGGWVATGGLRIRGPAGIRFTPEFRFTRWTSGQWLASRNQAELFLGIGF